MPIAPRPRFRGSGLHAFFAILVILVPLLGGAPGTEPPVAKETGCLVDVGHPLDLRVVPLGPVTPGATVNARVEFESRVPLDGVTLDVIPPPGVTVLSRPRNRVGTLAAGAAREETLTLIAPRGPGRSTVEVRVEGFADGTRITRGAVLNLVFQEEPGRVVTAPDGTRIHEVRAKRVDG